MARAQKGRDEKSLPQGWRWVRFGDVVRNVNAIEAEAQASGEKRYVGLNHLDPESLRITRWGLVEEGTTFTRKFEKGQVLFAKRRAYQRKAAIVDFSGLCSGDLLVFESKGELLPALLPFIVTTDEFFEHALRTSAGSLSPRTKWTELAKYEFALPPKLEQDRVASILWQLEDAIEAWAEALERLQVAKGAIAAAEFANDDRAVPLAQLCDADGIRIGPFGSQLHASDYVAEGTPVVMPADMGSDEILEEGVARVSKETVARLAGHKLRPGDILLPRRGELDRRALVHDHQRGWLCGTGSLRIRVKKEVSPRAVLYALGSPQTVKWLRNHAVGTTMPNLNMSIVSKIPVSMPGQPRLDEVIEALRSIENCQALVRKHRVISARMKRELSSSLLKGPVGVY